MQILGVTVEVHSEVRSSTLSVDVASVGPTPSSFAPSRGSSLPLSATFGVTTTRSVAGGPTEVVAEDVGKSAVGRPVGAGATAELFNSDADDGGGAGFAPFSAVKCTVSCA